MNRLFMLLMGIVAGLFLGAVLGQLTGAIIGFEIDTIYPDEIKLGEMVIGGGLGLLIGAIVATGFLALGKLLFVLPQSTSRVIAGCALMGLLIGGVTGSTLPEMISVFKILAFSSSVGLWVGIGVGIF